jgi:PBSX family phage terminase large subunit
MNATRAWMKLHPKTPYDSAKATASAFLTNLNVRAEIKRRMTERAMSAEEVLYRLGEMARAEIHPFIRIDDDGFIYFNFSDPNAQEYLYLIKKIKTKRERRIDGRGENSETWEGEWVEVELHDSQRALELLGKYHKMFGDKEQTSAGTESSPMSLPADLLAPDFLNVYRDIRSGNNTEYSFDGGRGSTKSSFISLVIPMLIVNNPTMHALALRQVKDTLRNSVYDQLKWAIGQMGLDDKFKCTVSPMEIEYLPTGQKIYFRGADDPTNIKSIKPPFGYIGILWLEEFDQFRGEAQVRNIVQSALRGGDKAFRFESWNTPRSKNHWLTKYMAIPKPARLHHHSTYLSVPREWLGQVFIDEAEYLKGVNPSAYDHEYMGLSNGLGGQVFENVQVRKITDAEIKQFDRVGQGADWGYYPDPFAWSKSHYDSARHILYVFDEYKAQKKSNRAVYDDLVKRKALTPDQLIIADSAEPKSIADFREYGAQIRGAEKGAESVNYSMKWLQSLAAIIIDPDRAPEHVQEFLGYELEQDKDGNYISEYPDKNNHFIDAVRYRTNLIWKKRGQ